MGRPWREDAVGDVFHLVNRGTAKRTIFEHRRDWRFFESRLAYAVRRGEITVLCFCLLNNHYHVLVRSLGRLSDAMRRIQTEHSTYFNRSRKREGPLVTGRYYALRVDTESHFHNAFRYIDENAVRAGLATRPESWPWGSAHLFAGRKTPRWLSRAALQKLGIRYGTEETGRVTRETMATRAALVDARMSRPFAGSDPLDTVMSGVPDRVWRWMCSTAALADGTRPAVPVAGIATVLRAIGALPPPTAALVVHLPRTRRHPMTRLLLAGLLRDVSAASFEEIGRAIQRSATAARRLHALHHRALVEHLEYREVAVALVEACVAPLRM